MAYSSAMVRGGAAKDYLLAGSRLDLQNLHTNRALHRTSNDYQGIGTILTRFGLRLRG